ncbi:uncharacterized protein LOC127864522 [Dreissena polymorpha]|uniref:uncharacterized protein LOC127864522 n=1 Tax=Dreissena polymorpha TaxID=45954 RepID=UPI0022644C6B|nr:uncharacterized protein LOC127864522 [Dreissena polymorpha]
MPTTIEKLQGQRLGLKNIIDRFVSKIEETSDEDDDIQFQALIEKLEEKVACLLVHNDKILSLTDADAAPDEMVEAEEYTFDVEVKLRRYKQRLQRPNIGITDAADLLSHASGSGSQQASAPLPPNNQRRVNTNSSNNSGQSEPEIKCKLNGRCQNCHRKHHTSICKELQRKPEVELPQSEAAVFFSSSKRSNADVVLKTAIATVSSSNTTTDAAILFDEGAQRSFITRKLADDLQLESDGIETLSLTGFGGSNNRRLQQLERTTVYIVSKKKKIPVSVLIVPTIAAPINCGYLRSTAELRGLKLAHPVTGDTLFHISLLVGADHYWDMVEDHVVRGNGPTAVKSKIGYLLSGPMPSTYYVPADKHILNVLASRAPEDSILERFWSLESMGISPCEPDRKSVEYLKQYQETSIEYDNGRYHAKLPWKQDHPALPTNHSITLKRTVGTIQRLRNEPEVLRAYGDIIAEQERRGFIERVPLGQESAEQVHYIPHHPVEKESSTTPIRIVYDCSCRQSRDSPSLNDCLESMPPELNELTSILVRFRLNPYAVSTDIEKAFLHVGLHEKDRDMTRFFWLENPLDPDSRLVTYRFKVVLFGATCSPFILNATLLKHLRKNMNVNAAHVIERDLYVDNVISSFKCEKDLLEYFTEARQLMSTAGMNLRSWISNSACLRTAAENENVPDTCDVTKVLGLRWDPKLDTINFVDKQIPILEKVTKRTVLKFSSQIYDPLGLLSPVTVRAKILLQEMWKQKYDWDTPLPSSLHATWSEIATDLNTVVRETSLRRQLIQSVEGTGSDVKPEMHVFVDASNKAYGAAVYICNRNESRLVIAKSRVTPVKSLSLPQLELMAALIGARLATNIQFSLHTTHITFWSDSQIVLHWLSTTNKLKKFVANRVSEINTLTNTNTWKYCPTHDNPADLLTRGVSANVFMKSSIWQTGPEWITDTRRWPIWETEPLLVNTILDEHAGTEMVPSHVIHTDISTGSLLNLQSVINISDYSSYRRLLRVTALRCAHHTSAFGCQRNCDTYTTEVLDSSDKTVCADSRPEVRHLPQSSWRSLQSPRAAAITEDES